MLNRYWNALEKRGPDVQIIKLINKLFAGSYAQHNELKSADKLPDDLDRLMMHGMYPPLYDCGLAPSNWFPAYVNTYIERDIRQLINVRNLSAFQRFIRMCAARIGQLLNLSSLAYDCGITHNTAAAWISVLEASYIIFMVRPHFANFNKRLIKSPKFYFLDVGLAAWLLVSYL